MGKIIEFDTGIDRKLELAVEPFDIADKEFETAAKEYEENANEENLASVLKSMRNMVKEVLKNPYLEEYMEKADRLYAEFLERYKTIINNAPRFDAGLRMQYFAGIMLGFVNSMFHADEKAKGHFFSDFADFYMLFDDSYSDFKKQYESLEKPYRYHGKIINDADVLEEIITSCLKNIIQLQPNDNDEQKTELLFRACELFEAYRSVLYMFTDED